MSPLTSRGAALCRPIVVAAMMVGSAAVAFAQAKPTPDTARKAAPPAKTVSAPAKTIPAPAKTGQPLAGQAKTTTPPVGQTKGPAASPQQSGASPRAGRGAPGLNVVTGDTASAAPLIMMREVFEYDRDGRRDPFISLLATTELRPTLSDLTLLMTVVDEPGRSVALVANSFHKKQKTLRVGDRLGRMRVSSIRADVVVFTIEEFGSNRRDSLLLRDSTKVRGR